MHGSTLRSSLTGPEWRCVYCGTIQKSFIITVLPQPCLALCHHDNHCVSLCFQAPRTGLSQILLHTAEGLNVEEQDCYRSVRLIAWWTMNKRSRGSDLDTDFKTNKGFVSLFHEHWWWYLISISMTDGTAERRKDVESFPEGKASGRAPPQSWQW